MPRDLTSRSGEMPIRRHTSRSR